MTDRLFATMASVVISLVSSEPGLFDVFPYFTLEHVRKQPEDQQKSQYPDT
jgi:hypothetical protein